MPKSTNLLIFPDVNVWIALAFDRHTHHLAARGWFDSLGASHRLCFCRFTQIGFLRLLTTHAVMGDDRVMNQTGAWKEYDRWFDDERVQFLNEPNGLEQAFRSFSRSDRPSRKDWADAYFVAFAAVAGLSLVTFDRGFRGRVDDLLLLES
jgi:uncharacterized protein